MVAIRAEQLCNVRSWQQLYCQLFLILCTLINWVSLAGVLVVYEADLDTWGPFIYLSLRAFLFEAYSL